MESTLNPRDLLIDSGASNHMIESRDFFSSIDTNKRIPIHMGDDSTIISKGQGIVYLEHGSFFNVLYVPSLTSNLLSVYQTTHTRVPKRVTFNPNDVEIVDVFVTLECIHLYILYIVFLCTPMFLSGESLM